MISSPKNVKIHIYLITQQFTPSYLPNRNENTYPQKTCIRMCVIALFLRAESQKHPNVQQRILSTSKQIVVYS